ncbi:MAG: hypothetical protein HC873_01100 [Leptolyngbyaceae cyanobacterium SL_1_1]|nr:hypothetical protein [Leptolyngbyaceae cyanobacterium RM1_1_2]NJO08466.1 hypothetical protein [Leptolyngbyaceae cyanobacterium SL_1_1]
MSPLTQRLSTAEISQRILEMAVTGVYRESVFETFRPVATKKQIRDAIAHAKHLGIRSVPQLRDEALGTYYQIDASRYATAQAIVEAEIQLAVGESPSQRLLVVTQALRATLGVSASFTVLFGLGSSLFWLNGQVGWASSTLFSSLSAAAIWAVQRQVAKNLV